MSSSIMQKSKVKNLNVEDLPPHQNLDIERLRAKHGQDLVWGFTMVEIVVMLAIIVAISTVLLTSFPGFNEDSLLIRTQQEMALNFRRAQNEAFSVAEVLLSDGSRQLPKRVGVHFDLASHGQYFLYIDEDSSGTYTLGDPQIEKPIIFQRGIVLDKLLFKRSVSDASNLEASVADVIFAAPQSNMEIRVDNVNAEVETLTIRLKSPNLGLRRNVTLRTSGQISLQ